MIQHNVLKSSGFFNDNPSMETFISKWNKMSKKYSKMYN
jgi:hypothetical protein